MPHLRSVQSLCCVEQAVIAQPRDAAAHYHRNQTFRMRALVLPTGQSLISRAPRRPAQPFTSPDPIAILIEAHLKPGAKTDLAASMRCETVQVIVDLMEVVEFCRLDSAALACGIELASVSSDLTKCRESFGLFV